MKKVLKPRGLDSMYAFVLICCPTSTQLLQPLSEILPNDIEMILSRSSSCFIAEWNGRGKQSLRPVFRVLHVENFYSRFANSLAQMNLG